MIEITDINDSRIGLYRNLKDLSFSHSFNQIFLAEGSIVTQELLRSNIEILSFFALPTYYDLYSDLINRKNILKDNQFTADKKLMNQIVGFHLHQGIMAIGKIPEHTVLFKLKPPIVVMNNIINSENVGAIIRNAVAFGINSVIYDKTTSSPFLRRAVRVSMGTIFSIEYYQSKNLVKDLDDLKKKNGCEIVASEISEDSISIDLYKFKSQSVIIFGNEGKGISREILSLCDKVVHIPISQTVQSINVAASSAILFHRISQKM